MLREFLNCFSEKTLEFGFDVFSEGKITITATQKGNYLFINNEISQQAYKVSLDFTNKNDFTKYKHIVRDLSTLYTQCFYDTTAFFTQWEVIFTFAKTGENWHKWV